MDSALIPEGVKRCSFKAFCLWLLVIFGVIGWGVVGVVEREVSLGFGMRQVEEEGPLN